MEWFACKRPGLAEKDPDSARSLEETQIFRQVCVRPATQNDPIASRYRSFLAKEQIIVNELKRPLSPDLRQPCLKNLKDVNQCAIKENGLYCTVVATSTTLPNIHDN